MSASQIELEFHRVLFAHHYGYRPVAVSKGIPAGVVEALEASKHHLYFIERKLDEAHRPLKYRFFRLSTERETYYVWARLEVMPDVVTHRGWVSAAQFYLIGGEQKARFERELQAHAVAVMAKIPFLSLHLDQGLRREEIKKIAAFSLSVTKPKSVAEQMLKLLQSSGLSEPALQQMLSEEVLAGLGAGKKIFFHSVRFQDDASILNVYCRGFFTGLLEVYRQTTSFTTAEFSTAIEDYDVVFLHPAAKSNADSRRENTMLISLDDAPAKPSSLWYLGDLTVASLEASPQEKYEYLSERLRCRNLAAMKMLKSYEDFLQSAQDRTVAEFKKLLETVEHFLADLNVEVIVKELGKFIRQALEDPHRDGADYLDATLKAAQRLNARAHEKVQEFQSQVMRYLAAWIDFFTEEQSCVMPESFRFWQLIDPSNFENKRDHFSRGLFAEVIKLSTRKKNLQDFVCGEFIFTGKHHFKNLNEHRERFQLVKEAALNETDNTDWEDAIIIQEELLNNLKSIGAAAGALIGGDLPIVRTPEFEQRFARLCPRPQRQNAFWENLAGFFEDKTFLSEGVILPILSTYLQKIPETETVQATEVCFDKIIDYLKKELSSSWESGATLQKLVDLFFGVKRGPLKNFVPGNIQTATRMNNKQQNSEASGIDCLVRIMAATQNQPNRVKKLVDVLAGKLARNNFEEALRLFLEGYSSKMSEEAQKIEALWREKANIL